MREWLNDFKQFFYYLFFWASDLVGVHFRFALELKVEKDREFGPCLYMRFGRTVGEKVFIHSDFATTPDVALSFAKALVDGVNYIKNQENK